MQKPPQQINDIFITHLHFDHWGDILYLYPFTASMGRWNDPLRITGPDGATPELGTKVTTERMKEMLQWHLDEFSFGPIGRGYDLEINEFDHRDENGICYDKNGVTGLDHTARTVLPPTGSTGTVSVSCGQATVDLTSSR